MKKPRTRDLLWAGMALAVGALFVAAITQAVVRAIDDGAVRQLLVTFAIVVPAGFWLGIGAWRRTRWGSSS